FAEGRVHRLGREPLGPARVDAEATLAGEDDAVAVAAERAAEDLLGLARVVAVGRVEVGDAPLEGAANDSLALLRGGALAEVHRAEDERGRSAGLARGDGLHALPFC